jgi:D-aspartate ligase
MISGHAVIVGRGFNALNIVWTLRAQGVECTVVCDKRTVAGWSRYARFLQCPDAATHEAAFQAFLLHYCKSLKTKPVIFPTNDKWAIALARIKGQLAPYAHCCVADAELVELLLDKDRFSKLGVERNYGTLPSYTAEDVRELGASAFPLIAKPNIREVSTNSTVRDALQVKLSPLRLTKINTPRDLQDFLTLHDSYIDEFVFQHYVAGNCSNMFSICVAAAQGGRVIGRFSGQKLRGYPVEYGDCARGATWSAPKDLMNTVDRICHETRYEGIAEFEFKKDENTGHFHLIEINPRSWSWIGITASVGDNLAALAFENYNLSASPTHTDTSSITATAMYGFFLAELAGAAKHPGNPFGATALGVFRDYFGGKVIFGDLNWRDPLPAVVALTLALRSFRHRG